MKDIRKIKHYAISTSTFVIQGQMIDDKLYSLVYDKDGFTLVKAKPNVLIAQALKKINSSFPHARDISKEILGEHCKKLPIVVGNNFGQPIIIFPLFSPGSKDNCWIIYNSITKIGGNKDFIQVEFKHRYDWTSEVSRQTFNNQYVNATNLYKAISQRWYP